MIRNALAPANAPPLHRREVGAIVKSLKSHVKNLPLCREYLLAIQERVFGDPGGACRTSFSKFTLNATGGIATLLATLEHHATDIPYLELALGFLHDCVYYGGKRNPRVIAKVVKKNGSRTMINLVTKNPSSARVLHPVCMNIIALATVDGKIAAMARVTGALGVLLTFVKSQHASVPSEIAGCVLSAICSLTRGDANQIHLGKKGATTLAMDLMARYLTKPGAAAVVKWASKLLWQLCGTEDNLQDAIKEKGVTLALNTLYESAGCVDTQRLCLDLIEVLTSAAEGQSQFREQGGVPFVVNLIAENNQDKREEELVELLCQLGRFHGEVELPIGKGDGELTWAPQARGKLEAASGSTGDDELGDGEEGIATPADDGPPPLRLSGLYPELTRGELDPEFRLPEVSIIHHVKPFTDGRPSPSCPSSMDYVPPLEELLQQTPQQRADTLKLEFKRYVQVRQLIRRVVFDDLPRSQTLPNTLLAQLIAAASSEDTAPQGADLGGDESPLVSAKGRNTSKVAMDSVGSFIAGSGSEDLTIATSSASQAAVGAAAALSNIASAATPSHTPPPPPPLKFGSNFESGNLRRAIQIFDYEYDLILHTDVNTTGYVQWFYFSVENMVPNVEYKFNIINMEKPTSTFSVGQRLLVFSERRFTWSGFGWLRTGHSIAYSKNSYRRRITKRKKVFGTYYTLTFSLRFPYAGDRIYLSNGYPYTYSDLLGHLRRLPEGRPHAAGSLMVTKLCDSESGNAVPLVTITSLSRNGVPCEPEEIRKRPVCVVSARVHPGESNSSYVAKGLIEYLLDTTEAAEYLRDNTVWKIIPMLNVDGVINGNHRCCLGGKDLNREFISPSRADHPTIYYLKSLIRHLKTEGGRSVMLYGDFHGHSRRQNCFCYACSGSAKKQVNGLCVEKVFPKLLGALVPYFTAEGSSYKVQRGKRCTGRVVIYRELGVRLSYTLESSMMGGDACDFVPRSFQEVDEEVSRRIATARQSQGHFNTAHYGTMGAMFAKAAMLLLKAEEEPSEGRAAEIISDMIAEVRTGSKSLRGGSLAPLSPVTPLSEEAAFAPTVSLSGSYANGRRGSSRSGAALSASKKGSKAIAPTVPPTSPNEVLEVVRAMLKGGPVQKRTGPEACATGGEDLDDGDEDDEDPEQDDDDPEAEDEDEDGDADPDVDMEEGDGESESVADDA